MIFYRVVNNLHWYGDMKALDFIGKIGRNFRVGTMLGKESVRSRMQSGEGISFTEFTYQLFQVCEKNFNQDFKKFIFQILNFSFQSYDWLRLFKDFNCRFQIGGSDQLGNIHSGYDLIQKVAQTPVYGLTIPLATTKEGDKFGKTNFQTIWLSEKLSSPFKLYQHFIRAEDLEVETLLLKYTFEKIEKIKELMALHKKSPEERLAQKALAQNVTLLVHGGK